MSRGFRINPHATLTIEREEGTVTSIKVRAPIRKESLRVSQISRATDPELFSALLLRQIAEAKGWSHEFSNALQGRLIDVGMLVREDQVSRPVNFYCDLTQGLLDLVPKRPRASFWKIPTAGLIVNPSLRFLGPSEAAGEISDLAVCGKRLRPDRYWCLITSPEQYIPRVYSFDDSQHTQLRELKPGEPAPGALDSDWRSLLVAAEILVTPEYIERAGDHARRKIDSARTTLQSNRYCVLNSVLHPFQLAAIRRYYREMVEEGYFTFGDDEWPLRFFAGNEPIGRLYHNQMYPLIHKITREDAKPTFMYFASYRRGAILPPHRDRDECDYAISLLIDFVPEPEDLCSWPIFVESTQGPNETVPVLLGIGDMLLYRGRELLHYRQAFKEGRASTTWLFFYQPEKTA